MVTMGDVSGPATWTSGEGWLEIVFDTSKLSPDHRRDLECYRSSSRPIDVQLPGDEQAMSCVVIGFDRSARLVVCGLRSTLALSLSPPLSVAVRRSSI